jgi:hypothetical protein
MDCGYVRNGVSLQRGVLENGTVNGAAKIVVGWRFGEDFDEVLDRGDAFEARVNVM